MVKRERVLDRFRSRVALTVGETVENGTIRVHRYSDVIVILDLTNAGKRGKRVEKISVSPKWTGSSEDRYALLYEIGDKLERCRNLGQVKKVLEDFQQVDVNSYSERGIDTTPAGFKEVTVHTPHVYIEVGYKNFVVRNLDDQYNEPTCIPAIKGGLRSIPVFYRWVQDNQGAIKNMNFNEIVRQMRALGIQFHQYCAVD